MRNFKKTHRIAFIDWNGDSSASILENKTGIQVIINKHYGLFGTVIPLRVEQRKLRGSCVTNRKHVQHIVIRATDPKMDLETVLKRLMVSPRQDLNNHSRDNPELGSSNLEQSYATTGDRRSIILLRVQQRVLWCSCVTNRKDVQHIVIRVTDLKMDIETALKCLGDTPKRDLNADSRDLRNNPELSGSKQSYATAGQCRSNDVSFFSSTNPFRISTKASNRDAPAAPLVFGLDDPASSPLSFTQL